MTNQRKTRQCRYEIIPVKGGWKVTKSTRKIYSTRDYNAVLNFLRGWNGKEVPDSTFTYYA